MPTTQQIVLQGVAKICFEDQTFEMNPGDYVNIPAHKKHRVEWTTPDEPTIWLAVHYGDGE
jgi:cupin 2 domain-containing protein